MKLKKFQLDWNTTENLVNRIYEDEESPNNKFYTLFSIYKILNTADGNFSIVKPIIREYSNYNRKHKYLTSSTNIDENLMKC